MTFTADVAAIFPGGGTPSGTVTFSADGTLLGTAPVQNGIATFTIASLPIGSHSITASYSDTSDDDYLCSVSQLISLLVLSPSLLFYNAALGESDTLQVTDGVVQILSDGIVVASQPLSDVTGVSITGAGNNNLTIIPAGMSFADGAWVGMGSNSTVTLDDSTDTSGGTDTISATQITAGPATINLVGNAPLQQLTVDGGIGSDIQIASTPGPTNVESAGSTAISVGTTAQGTAGISGQLAIQVDSGTNNSLNINQTGSIAYGGTIGPAGTSTQTDELVQTSSSSSGATISWTALTEAAFDNVTLDTTEMPWQGLSINAPNWPLDVVDQVQGQINIWITGSQAAAPITVDASSLSGGTWQTTSVFGTLDSPVTIDAGTVGMDTSVDDVSTDTGTGAVNLNAELGEHQCRTRFV